MFGSLTHEFIVTVRGGVGGSILKDLICLSFPSLDPRVCEMLLYCGVINKIVVRQYYI